jgi:hypothetical protein
MRLIIKSAIFILLIFSSNKMAAQVDTIDISESFLEDRHIQYMYNFALNNTFFQYRSSGNHIHVPLFIKKPTQNEMIFIINHKFPIKIDDLELFIRPDTLLGVKFVNNFDQAMESVGFISQFAFKFLYFDELKSIDFFTKLTEIIFDSPNSSYAVQFSNFLIRGYKIYISINISFPVNYEPDLIYSNYQMYEFEWCESVGWVYPRRVSDSFFRSYHFKKGRLGGTVEIPSLRCFPLEK